MIHRFVHLNFYFCDRIENCIHAKKEEQFLQRINAKQPEAFRKLFSEFYNSLVLLQWDLSSNRTWRRILLQECLLPFGNGMPNIRLTMLFVVSL